MEGNTPNIPGTTDMPTLQPREPQVEHDEQVTSDVASTVSPTPTSAPETQPESEPVSAPLSDQRVAESKYAQHDPDAAPVYTRVKLRRTVMINGKGYPAGKDLTVLQEVADELRRIEETNLEYEADLLRAKDQVSTPAAELKIQ